MSKTFFWPAGRPAAFIVVQVGHDDRMIRCGPHQDRLVGRAGLSIPAMSEAISIAFPSRSYVTTYHEHGVLLLVSTFTASTFCSSQKKMSAATTTTMTMTMTKAKCSRGPLWHPNSERPFSTLLLV
jgi:hypothetical protein